MMTQQERTSEAEGSNADGAETPGEPNAFTPGQRAFIRWVVEDVMRKRDEEAFAAELERDE